MYLLKRTTHLILLVVSTRSLPTSPRPRAPISNCSQSMSITQPVHDELEYIKMRYRSPARHSFKHNRTYDTLNTTATSTTTYTTTIPDHDTNEDEQNPRRKHNSTSSSHRNIVSYSPGGFESDIPWSQQLQTNIRGSVSSVSNQQQHRSITEDYGFNSSPAQPLVHNAHPGQTVI